MGVSKTIIFVLIIFNGLKAASSFQTITFGNPEDVKIISENYPEPYTEGANITWTWDVPTGQWGVVFSDFDLDRSSDGFGDGDWLQVEDRSQTPVQYSANNPPVIPFRSKGPKLVIRFSSDRHTSSKHFRGFKLRILYGKTESEVYHKLIEVVKEIENRNNESDKEPDDASALNIIIIVMPIVAVVIFIAIIVYLCKETKRCRQRYSLPSSATYTRDGTVSQQPTANSPPRVPPVAAASNTGASVNVETTCRTPGQVQRSNSQLGWSARAELMCSSLQAERPSARSNDYGQAPGSGSHETNIKCTISLTGNAHTQSVTCEDASSRHERDVSRLGPTATPHANANNTGASVSGLGPARKFNKSCSEENSRMAAQRNVRAPANKGAVSLPHLTVIQDDGAGDFVDTIDNLDPIPMDAIRGKVPRKNRDEQNVDDIDSISVHLPPPYPCDGFDPDPDASFYENVVLGPIGNQQDSHDQNVYVNTSFFEDMYDKSVVKTLPETEHDKIKAPPRKFDTESITKTLAKERQNPVPPADESPEDYVTLVSSDQCSTDLGGTKQKMNSDNLFVVFPPASQDKVFPATSDIPYSIPPSRSRLDSAYDVPPVGDGDDTATETRCAFGGQNDIGPRSKNDGVFLAQMNINKDVLSTVPPRACDAYPGALSDCPYSVPPRSDSLPADSPYVVPPPAGYHDISIQLKSDSPYDIPPSSH